MKTLDLPGKQGQVDDSADMQGCIENQWESVWAKGNMRLMWLTIYMDRWLNRRLKVSYFTICIQRAFFSTPNAIFNLLYL